MRVAMDMVLMVEKEFFGVDQRPNQILKVLLGRLGGVDRLAGGIDPAPGRGGGRAAGAAGRGHDLGGLGVASSRDECAEPADRA